MFFSRLTLLIIFLCPTLCWAYPIHIVTATQDFEAIAKRIGGEHVNVDALVQGSRDLHQIQPKPSMVMKVRKADMIIRIGLKQDGWVDSIIEVSKNKALFKGGKGYVDASEGIDLLEIPDHNIDGRHGDVHKYGNPHYWLDPSNGKIIAWHITQKLSEISPDHADIFYENYQNYSKLLDSKIGKWTEKMNLLQSHTFITYHKVWSYFFKAFGCKSIGELERLPGIPPTPSHIQKMKNAVEKESNVIVLMANYFPKTIGQSFASSINARFVHVPANVGEDQIDSYIDLFETIIDRLIE